MSLSVTRKLICSTGKLLRSSARYGAAVAHGNVAYCNELRAATSKTLTRSLWHMCRADDTRTKKFPVLRRCNCRSIHTQGDKELSDFLTEEIGIEKKSERTPAGSVKGFQVVSSKGADVELQKKNENETITIRLNVNGTVDDDYDYNEGEQSESQEGKMVAKPPFIVEINKGGDTTLAMQCSFPPPGEGINTNPEDQQQYEDLIEIQEVTLLKGEKWGDDTYCVQGSILDGNLYDMLLNMLEERGIDGQFVDQLVDYSTSYEHKKYLGFLQGLQDFANSN